jgi:hypothetical protein
MKQAPLLLLGIITFVAVGTCGWQTKSGGQIQTQQATVEIRAFEANGRPLAAPNVDTFISLENNKDYAKSFHDGSAAEVPFGDYRIEVGLPFYYSERQFVGVYQKSVTIVVGLEFGHEAFGAPHTLRGRVVGLQPADTKTSFVKLVGIYSSASLESGISPEGSFEMSGMSDQKYLLLVIDERGILASKTISFSDITSGQPVVIDVNQPAN